VQSFTTKPEKKVKISFRFNHSFFAPEDFYISPHGWNSLHLLTIFKDEDFYKALEDPDFTVPFLVDNYGRTPLHYLLSQPNIEFTTIVALIQFTFKFLKNEKVNRSERQLAYNSLTELFPYIVLKFDNSVTLEYLKLIMRISDQDSENLPSFGKVKEKYVVDIGPTMRESLLPKLYKEGRDEICFQTLQLNWDYNPASDDMLNCAKTILEIDDEEILKTPAISHLIDHLWNSTRPTLIVFGIFYLILVTLISAYIGIGERNIALEVIILILTVFAFISELLQVSVFKMDYFKELWNWFDLSQHFLVIAFIITRFADDEDELTRGWLVTSIVIVCYSRLLSYLRLFSASSKHYYIIESLTNL